MKLNKIYNTKRNIIWGIINNIIMMLCPLILRSIIIHTIGIEYLGISSLLSSILQVLSLADLGFEGAIVYSMYKPIADDDTETICALLGLYRRIYRCIGLIILTMGLMVLPFLKYFIKGGYPSQANIYILFVIYLFNTVFSYMFFAYKESLFKAHQRADITSKTILLANAAMYMSQIVVLCLFHNYYVYAVLIPIFTISRNLLCSRIADRMYPQLKCRGYLKKEIIVSIKKNVFGLMLYKICGVFRNSFDSIIISSFLGLVILARYQNYYMIMNAVIAMMSILSSSVLAGIGNSIMTKVTEEIYAEFKVWSFVYNWIASWCTICLVCLIQPVMELWMGTENILSADIMVLVVIYFYILKVGDVLAVYREAAGVWWKDKYRPVIEAFSNLFLNIVLVKYWGLCGVLLSSILTITFINLPWSAHIIFRDFFRQTEYLYYKEFLLNAMNVLFIGLFTYFICQNVGSAGISTIIIRGVVCLIVPNLIYLVVYFRRCEFKTVISILKVMLLSRN